MVSESPLMVALHSPSSMRPVVESASVGGVETCLVGGPEPSVDVLGQKVLAIAAVKVAETTRRPDVLGL